MQTYHTVAIDSLMASPAVKKDAQELVSKCIVRAIHEFSTLNIILLKQGQKKLTDKTRGLIFDQLAAATNLLMILYHATSTAVPKEDDLMEYADEYPTDYSNDGILASLYSIASLTSIAAIIFDSDIGNDPDAPSSEEALEEVETSLVEIYSGIIVTCELCDIDFEEIVQYASKRKDWE